MSQALSYDIWRHVAKFIPKPTLLKLYSLNSAFFDVVMNEDYREVQIYHTGDQRTLRCLLNTSCGSRAHHAPRPHLLCESNMPIPSDGSALGTPDLISQMTNVTSLPIGCHPPDDWKMFVWAMSFVETAWSAHGSRLRNLTLAIPLETYSDLLSSASMIKHHPAAESTTVWDEILLSIVAFINRQARTLSHLSIDTPESGSDTSIPFNTLGRRLQPQIPSGIDKFLKKDADLLQELTLQFYGPSIDEHLPSPSAFFSHPIFRVPLPCLTSLDLGLCQWEKSIQSLVSVFSGEASVLRSLEMHIYRNSIIWICVSSLDTLVGRDDGSWIANYYWNGYDGYAAAFVKCIASRQGRWDECRKLLAEAYLCNSNRLSPFFSLNEYTTLMSALQFQYSKGYEYDGSAPIVVQKSPQMRRHLQIAVYQKECGLLQRLQP
ncbi:hypothetical protein BDZ97DRAFT_1970003 [Flammula alnicola]|nr:hypothetical protein BDZ97DRAFT_1970003 [Flammula alnicola]